VRLSSRDLGFEDKLFRILSMGLNVDGTVKLDGVEYYDEVYTPGTLPEISVAAKTGRPADGNDSSNGASAVVAPPTNINASVGSVQQTDGTYLSKIDVSWTAPTTGGIANYEIVLTGTTNATYITSATSYTITGLPNGTYYVSVRSVNTYGSKSTLVDSLA
jgi:predicted phage tail protein